MSLIRSARRAEDGARRRAESAGSEPLMALGDLSTSCLHRAAGGDAAARQQLLARHRARLRRMVAIRLDRRLAARVDPSDLVQESLADAARGLDAYLKERPLPFYPWLRQFAVRRLANLH